MAERTNYYCYHLRSEEGFHNLAMFLYNIGIPVNHVKTVMIETKRGEVVNRIKLITDIDLAHLTELLKSHTTITLVMSRMITGPLKEVPLYYRIDILSISIYLCGTGAATPGTLA